MKNIEKKLTVTQYLKSIFNNKSYLITTIAVIISIGLLLLYLQCKYSLRLPAAESISCYNTDTDKLVVDREKFKPQASSSAQFSKEYLTTLSEDEAALAKEIEKILDGNGLDLRANYFLIRTTSKEGTLNISKCEPRPLVLRVEQYSKFKVINDDDVGHMINTGKFERYVPPKGSREFQATFDDNVGSFPYSCDKYPKGIFWVYPKGLFPYK